MSNRYVIHSRVTVLIIQDIGKKVLVSIMKLNGCDQSVKNFLGLKERLRSSGQNMLN